MCLTPITLHNKIRKMNDLHTQIVPCGRCVLCLKRRSAAWAFRLGEEQKISTSAAFLTFTYDTEHIPISKNGRMTLNKKHYQDFTKRLRQETKYLTTTPLKYYACGEYGDKLHRPHYHAIMFNLPQKALINSDLLHSSWGQGNIDIQPCNGATIRYVTNYITKGKFTPSDYVNTKTGEIFTDDRVPDFALMSKKMGLNHLSPQMKKYYKQNLKSYVTRSGGAITSLPRYFRDKVFTEQEKRKLNKQAEITREEQFEKLFNNSYETELSWKIDQIRKQEKQQRLSRNKC